MATRHPPTLGRSPHAATTWARRGIRHVARWLVSVRRLLAAAAIAIVESPTGGPRASLISLGLALVVAVVVLRAIAGTDDAPTRAPGTVAPAQRDARQFIRTVAPARPLARPPRPATYTDLQSAAKVLDRTVWAPAVLPAGATLLAVTWQPDNVPPREPGAAPAGMLRTVYSHPDRGPVLQLSQGPGIGVSGLNAPEGMWGTVPVADREIIWVQGHAWVPDEVRHWAALDPWGWGCDWTGSELRAGVAPAGLWGWRLESETLSLDELLAVAGSMATITPTSPARILWLVASEEQADVWRRVIATAEREGLGGQHNPLLPEVIVVHLDDEAWFWQWLAHDAAMNGGTPSVTVIDLRPPAGDIGPQGNVEE